MPVEWRAVMSLEPDHSPQIHSACFNIILHRANHKNVLQAIRFCMKTTHENIKTNNEEESLNFWTTEDLRRYVPSHIGQRIGGFYLTIG